MYILANLQSGENRRMHIKYYSSIQPLQLGYMSITTNGIGTVSLLPETKQDAKLNKAVKTTSQGIKYESRPYCDSCK